MAYETSLQVDQRPVLKAMSFPLQLEPLGSKFITIAHLLDKKELGRLPFLLSSLYNY